jgi:RecA-family ATPase
MRMARDDGIVTLDELRARAAAQEHERKNGYSNGHADRAADPTPALLPISPSAWVGDPPPYDWLVEGCFLAGTVALLSGDGGLGKSLLMQQLCTAMALGQPWIGLETKQCNTLALFCEDDAEELWRRQQSINRHYGCTMADLSSVTYLSRVGEESILVNFDRFTDEAKATPFLGQIRDLAIDLEIRFLILDTASDVFGGDEINRQQVRRFISILRRLALDINGCAALTSHPSNTGMSTGSGRSGSTGWHNSVRSRLYLTSTAADNEEDTSERLLKTMKQNHGPFGGKIGLRWADGVFEQIRGEAPLDLFAKLELDGKILDALRYLVGNGTRVAADPKARNSLSALLRTLPTTKTLKTSAIIAAQDRLIAAGKISKVEIGPASKRYVFVRTTDTKYPGER